MKVHKLQTRTESEIIHTWHDKVETDNHSESCHGRFSTESHEAGRLERGRSERYRTEYSSAVQCRGDRAARRNKKPNVTGFCLHSIIRTAKMGTNFGSRDMRAAHCARVVRMPISCGRTRGLLQKATAMATATVSQKMYVCLKAH